MLALLVAPAACREAAPPFAGTQPGGPERVHQLFTALYDRYANIRQGPKYAYANVTLTRTALVPSLAFDDTAIWTAEPDSLTRELQLAESIDSAGVTVQDAARSAPWPTRVGEAKHVIELHKLGDDDYAWDTNASIAIGSISAADVANGIVALLTSAGDRTTSEIRADYLAAFPHTAAVLSQLFVMDSLYAVPQADGSAIVHLRFTMRPSGLDADYPAFGSYMQKYVDATAGELELSDHAGTAYFHGTLTRGGPVEVLARVRGRDFLPLGGGETPLPDSLTLSGWFSTHVMIFTVGVKHFTSDFVTERAAHMRSWTLHFGTEPEWDLPLAAAHFLGGPLKRPFEGRGMLYRVSVRDSAGAQTILNRTSHVEVEESAIMRFIGGLISRVLLEQEGDVEKQEYRYYASAFAAMRRDFGNVLADTVDQSR